MSEGIVIIVIVILLTILFDFINGFHDTANSIATSIATKALSPAQAIIMASILELVGALFSTKVAETVGKGIVNINIISLQVILASVTAAIVWNLITWYYGIPSSSSHALIGGLVGAALAKSWYLDSVLWSNLILKVILPLLLAPVIGFIAGAILMIVLLWILRPFKPSIVNKTFTKLQVITSAFVAFSHGANDAQKSMGIITLALVSGSLIPHFSVPLWVKIVCALALALGTAAGGWKIIKTMGNNICKLKPVNGFAAQAATAAVINSATFVIGAPVSTTHIISSSIMGVGATKRFSAVRWKVARDLLYTWVITIPVCAIVGGLIYKLVNILNIS